MVVFGWDASDFDWSRGPMDLAAAVRDGITFFTHKATEGTKIQHWKYGEAMRRAVDAGMEFRGAYIVVRTPGNNGHGSVAQQVAYYLAYLDQQTPSWRADPGFFHQVDTEHWSDSNGVVYDAVAPQYGVEACRLLRAQTGKQVMHYAPRWSYGDSVGGTDPLWASAYGTNPAVPYRNAYPGDSASGWAPYSGRTPAILQYGSRLTIGSQPICDADAFRGSLNEFRALVTGKATTVALADEKIPPFKRPDQPRQYDPNLAYGITEQGGGWTWDQALRTMWWQTYESQNVILKMANSLADARKDIAALTTLVSQLGQPTDAQLAAQADRIAAALIASNTNGLTPADHDGVVADLKRALREGTK